MSAAEASAPLRARGYIVLIVLAGAALLTDSIIRADFWSNPAWLVMMLFTVVAAVFGFRFRLPWRGIGGLAVTVGDCFVFAAVLLFNPAAAVVLSAIEALIVNVRFRVRSPDRFLFNIGQMAVTTWLIGHVFVRIHFHSGESLWAPLDLDALPPLMACALLYFLVNSSLIAAGMCLTAGMSFPHLWLKAFPIFSPANLLNAAAALVASRSLDPQPILPVALSLILGLLLLALSQLRVRRLNGFDA